MPYQDGEIIMFCSAAFGSFLVFSACVYYRCCKNEGRRRKANVPAHTGNIWHVKMTGKLSAIVNSNKLAKAAS